MTTVKWIPILSNPDLASPRPWYVLEYDRQILRVTSGNQRGSERRHTAGMPVNLNIVNAHPTVEYRSEMWTFGVSLAGEFFFCPVSECERFVDAHLGFYYPLDDRLELFEFIDEREGR